MKTPASLIRLRRSTVLWLVTVTLLVLVISPFTAPFSTYELEMLSGNAPISADLLSAEKKIQKDVTTSVVSDTSAPVLLALFFPRGTTAGRVESWQVLPIVLRL